MRETATRQVSVTSRTGRPQIMRRVSDLLAQSETRQQQELALASRSSFATSTRSALRT